MKKKITYLISIFLLIFTGYFVIVKISQVLNVRLDSVILAYSIYFSACLYAYLGYRYFKYVKKSEYDKKTFAAISVGFFVLGGFSTYIVSNLISQILTLVFAYIFSIDIYVTSQNNDQTIHFTYLMGAISCVIAVAVYHIAAERKLGFNKKDKKNVNKENGVNTL